MARAFNGTTATVAVDAAHLTQPGIAFSIAAWIKTAAANGEVYGEGNSGAAGPFFQVTTDGTGQVILVAARTASSGGADTLTGAAVVGNSA